MVGHSADSAGGSWSPHVQGLTSQAKPPLSSVSVQAPWEVGSAFTQRDVQCVFGVLVIYSV